MNSLLISITGNICSGKSSVAEILSAKTGIPVFSIDQYRITFKAFDYDGERLAWFNLINDISRAKTAIFESSGLSANVDKVYSSFERRIIVFLDPDETILLRRLSQRRMKGYSEVPYPFKKNSLPDSVRQMGVKFLRLRYNLKFDTEKMTPEVIADEIIKSI
jgi:broad-specificity NMP kinase